MCRISDLLLSGWGFPCGAGGKEPARQCKRRRRCEFDLWVGKIPLKKGMTTHFSILAWRIPWTEEPGRLQSMRSNRVRHDWVTEDTRVHPIKMLNFLTLLVMISDTLASEVRVLGTASSRRAFFIIICLGFHFHGHQDWIIRDSIGLDHQRECLCQEHRAPSTPLGKVTNILVGFFFLWGCARPS